MSDYQCPIDGCSYTGSEIGLRNHANTNPDHDWSEVQRRLDNATDDETDEKSSTASESTTDETDDKTDDETDETSSTGAGSATDATNDNDDNEESSTASGSVGIPIPVESTTLVMLVALLLMALLLQQYAATPEQPDSTESDTGAEDSAEIDTDGTAFDPFQ